MIQENRPQYRTGLNSKYSMSKCIIAKEQNGGQWMKNCQEEISELMGDSG